MYQHLTKLLLAGVVAVALLALGITSMLSPASAAKPGKLPLSCVLNQVAKSDGIAEWVCANDIDTTLDQAGVEGLGFFTGPHTVDTDTQLDAAGIEALVGPHTGGTVTNVGSGTGLIGGPITTSGTLSVDVGTAANQIPRLDAGGLLPVIIIPSGIDAAKISSGAVSNTEFNSLDGVTSSIQAQLNAIATVENDLFTLHSLVSLNGNSLIVAPRATGVVGYTGTGIGFAATEGDTFSVAPIQLPHGAEILGIQCGVEDSDNPGRIDILLQRGSISTTDPADLIADVFTGGTDMGGFRQVSDVTPAFAVVDNSNFGYFFRVDFLDVTASGVAAQAIALSGCSVALGIL